MSPNCGGTSFGGRVSDLKTAPVLGSALGRVQERVCVMVAAVQEIERGYSQPFGPGPPCTFICVIAMQAIDVADLPSRRQRLRGKQCVSHQVADSPSKRRRLNVKQSVQFLYPPPSLSPVVVLPLGTSLWKDLDEATFEDLTHRRRYRMIYDKFATWWFCGHAVWV